ncbi:hypothetical protein VaNZ11_009782 [Volvox africanus]|uniref:Protein kinase domain-containing protein n=1 Tax=Volvox africanus TaxID=51714 RepID=A0ABQ5S809_9CHLO|nr:hypothetical protein VaNZ11_009782 [Volvox africanus]
MDIPAKDYAKASSSNTIDLVSLRISKELGRGGFASCWAATYNGRNVAVKVLKTRPRTATNKARIGDAEGAGAGHVATRKPPNEDLYDRMFLREAQLMMKLKHKHLVRCFGVTRLPASFLPKQPEPALAMLLELCEVNTIKDLITKNMTSGRRVYKVKQAYVWLLQIASAIAHLHNQKPTIIHRDIKPENILLARDSDDNNNLICKITDLGLHVEISDDRPVMLRRSAKHPAFSVKQQNTPSSPCITPPPAGGNKPAATSTTAAAATTTATATVPAVVAVAGGRSTPSTPKRTSPPLRRQASSIAVGSSSCQVAAAADESDINLNVNIDDIDRSPFLKVSAGPSFNSARTCAGCSTVPTKREVINTCWEVRDELGMSPLHGATSVPPIVRQPSYSSGANSQGGGFNAIKYENHNIDDNRINQAAALSPKPELDPTQMVVCLQQQQQQQQQRWQEQHKGQHQHQHQHQGKSDLVNGYCQENHQANADPPAAGTHLQVGKNTSREQQEQQQQQKEADVEICGDGNEAMSSLRPNGLPSASEKLSALLIRHPDLVEPVSISNPAVGLRAVSDLLEQFGTSELTPLKRHELEWVFGLTGKAGSLMYMAPEVFRNQPYNEKSDVFSFGVLAYELLACEVLSLAIFNTTRAARLGVQRVPDYAALVARGYRPARVRVISDAAWALIESCWHQDPVQRPSMDQVQAELQRLVAELEDPKEAIRGGSSKQQPWANAKQQQQQQQWLPAAGGSKRAPRVTVGDTPECLPCAIC